MSPLNLESDYQNHKLGAPVQLVMAKDDCNENMIS